MRPKVRKYIRPKKISEYPNTPAYESGHLVSINAGWRTFIPIVDSKKCIGCLQCYLLCPDGVIGRTEEDKVNIDYDYCKGCGICAQVCKFNAIEMKKEDK
ncbi:MAG TPA: 4Fe-4S binding protein [Anaerovoracaceae bacterium]|nr:4Fe-4S binding protein [Anaerovoracaceae bacterium]